MLVSPSSISFSDAVLIASTWGHFAATAKLSQ